METRLRDSVLRVLRPTLSQVSEIDLKQQETLCGRGVSMAFRWRLGLRMPLKELLHRVEEQAAQLARGLRPGAS